MAFSTRPEYSPKLSVSSACGASCASSGTSIRLAGAKVASAAPDGAASPPAPPSAFCAAAAASGGSSETSFGAKSHEATAEPRKVSKTRPTKTALLCEPVTERFQYATAVDGLTARASSPSSMFC